MEDQSAMDGVLRILVRLIDRQENEIEAYRFAEIQEKTAEKRAANLMAENAKLKEDINKADYAVEMQSRRSAALSLDLEKATTELKQMKAKRRNK